ncbi:MAG: chemotaxis protein [Rhodocyclaceae bacterium]|nr:chemotaxis protein [Rhodocyclaceae bacterium]MBX3668007.1 chemotaxis protein [Rhodocyclaceae bacterium]
MARSGITQDEAAGQLRRLVQINEQIKAVVSTAFKINLMALNAIFLSKRAGQAALGFGVLSNELRQFAVELTEKMAELRSLVAGSLRGVTDLLKHARNRAIMERVDSEAAAARASIQALLVRQRVTLDRQESEMDVLHRRLGLLLDEIGQLVELGGVLARSAKIEAAYGGSFAAALMQVSTDFDQIIGVIRSSLDALEKSESQEVYA